MTSTEGEVFHSCSAQVAFFGAWSRDVVCNSSIAALTFPPGDSETGAPPQGVWCKCKLRNTPAPAPGSKKGGSLPSTSDFPDRHSESLFSLDPRRCGRSPRGRSGDWHPDGAVFGCCQRSPPDRRFQRGRHAAVGIESREHGCRSGAQGGLAGNRFIVDRDVHGGRVADYTGPRARHPLLSVERPYCRLLSGSLCLGL